MDASIDAVAKALYHKETFAVVKTADALTYTATGADGSQVTLTLNDKASFLASVEGGELPVYFDGAWPAAPIDKEDETYVAMRKWILNMNAPLISEIGGCDVVVF